MPGDATHEPLEMSLQSGMAATGPWLPAATMVGKPGPSPGPQEFKFGDQMTVYETCHQLSLRHLLYLEMALLDVPPPSYNETSKVLPSVVLLGRQQFTSKLC